VHDSDGLKVLWSTTTVTVNQFTHVTRTSQCAARGGHIATIGKITALIRSQLLGEFGNPCSPSVNCVVDCVGLCLFTIVLLQEYMLSVAELFHYWYSLHPEAEWFGVRTSSCLSTFDKAYLVEIYV